MIPEMQPDEFEDMRQYPDDFPTKDKRSPLEYASAVWGKKIAPDVKLDMEYWEWLWNKPNKSTFDLNEMERLSNKYNPHC